MKEPKTLMSMAGSTQLITQAPEFKSWFASGGISDDKGEPLLMFRGSSNAGARPSKANAQVYVTPHVRFATHYARGGVLHAAYARALHPLDCARGEGRRLWVRFLRETCAPTWAEAATSRGALPYWTIAPHLRDWLRDSQIACDAIWFAEADGTASLALNGLDQMLIVGHVRDPERLPPPGATPPVTITWQPGGDAAEQLEPSESEEPALHAVERA